jgi:hypothetical protein
VVTLSIDGYNCNMEGSKSLESPISKSYRDLPEWKKAQAAYLAESDDPELDFLNRIEVIFRMRDIEERWEASALAAGDEGAFTGADDH